MIYWRSQIVILKLNSNLDVTNCDIKIEIKTKFFKVANCDLEELNLLYISRLNNQLCK